MGLTNRLKALLAHKQEYSQWHTIHGKSQIDFIEEWKDLSNYYLSKGFSKSKTYEKVAEQYGISSNTIRYWLIPSYREKHLAYKRNSIRKP